MGRDRLIGREYEIRRLEMKFSINEFVIDKECDRLLRNKIDTFRRATGTKKTLQLTMITTFGVRPGKYSGLAGTQVLLDDLFD